MTSRPFFVLSRLNSDGEIVGTSYFYGEMSQEQKAAILATAPEARINDALSAPAAVEVFVPLNVALSQTSALSL